MVRSASPNPVSTPAVTSAVTPQRMNVLKDTPPRSLSAAVTNTHPAAQGSGYARYAASRLGFLIRGRLQSPSGPGNGGDVIYRYRLYAADGSEAGEASLVGMKVTRTVG